MKFFTGQTEINYDTLSTWCADRTYSVTNRWSGTFRVRSFCNDKVLCVAKDNYTCVLYMPKTIAELHNYYCMPSSTISLKYVPKKIKDADYLDLNAYLDAVSRQ